MYNICVMVCLFTFFTGKDFPMAEKLIKISSAERRAGVFGSFDSNTRLIESEFGVQLFECSDGIKILGDELHDIENAANAIEYLLKMNERGETLNEQTVRYVIGMVGAGSAGALQSLDGDCICITSRGKPIKAKTVGQKSYLDSIASNTVTIAVGPAGTGKRFLPLPWRSTPCAQSTSTALF